MRIKKTSQYINDGLKGYVLYDNEDGTTDTFNLNSSVSNYEYIEIIYGFGTNDLYMNSTKIIPALGKRASMILPIYGSTIYMLVSFIELDNTTATFGSNGEILITSSGGVSVDTQRKINVYKVIGYK